MGEQALPAQEENLMPDQKNQQVFIEDIQQMKEDIAYLKDLFIRRLSDDKQKNAVIQRLSELVSFTFIEPFLHDIILLLDRLEKSNDDFVMSVAEELYDIIKRRGVEQIEVKSCFNPSLYKAVKVIDDPNASDIYVSGIVRNGYLFSGKVLRPAEVIVGRPNKKSSEKEEA